jgi:multiple sugar transport system substrate-binding protein
MKKIALFVAVALVAVTLALPARNIQAQGEPKTAGLDQRLDGITIRMSVISGVQYDPMYKSIPDFEKATGAKVEIVSQLDGFNIDKKQKTDYATNAVDYDVAWNHTSFMMQYIDYVEDLNQYFTKDELSQYSKAIIDSATVNGKLLLIPRVADVSQLYYRSDLFTDPKIMAAYKTATGKDLVPPTTLEDVDTVARFFVKNGYTKYGYGIAGKEEGLTGRFYEMLFASGGQFLDDKGQPAFNSDTGIKVASLLHGWWQDGIIAKDTPSLIWDGVAQNFCNGDVAMQLDWPGYYGYYGDPKSCPKIVGKFGIATGFTGFAGPNSRRIGWAGAHAFSIPKAAKQKAAAAQLIKFLTSEKIAYDEAKLGSLPVRNDVWARIIADADKSTNPLDKQRLQIASKQISDDFKTPPLTANWIPISDVVYPTIQKIIIGDVDPKAGLDQAAKDAAALLQ